MAAALSMITSRHHPLNQVAGMGFIWYAHVSALCLWGQFKLTLSCASSFMLLPLLVSPLLHVWSLTVCNLTPKGRIDLLRLSLFKKDPLVFKV